jgi:hypothetical protein
MFLLLNASSSQRRETLTKAYMVAVPAEMWDERHTEIPEGQCMMGLWDES